MASAGTSLVPTEIATAPSSEATSSTYPPCAQLCLADATASLPCAETNSACLCLHALTVKNSVTSCLNSSKACSVVEASTAASYYDEVCQALGYPTSESQAGSAPIMTAAGRPTAPIQSPSPTASASSNTHSHPSLSVPTIAGIAAGVAFLLVCAITVALFFYVRRRSTKPSNPTVTIESPNPFNPRERLRKTVSLRQSALYSPDHPEWNEKLTHIATLTDNEKHLEHDLSYNHIERKKSLPQTPPPVYTKAPATSTTKSTHPPKKQKPTPRTKPEEKSRPPSIVYPSPFNPRLLFERSISDLAHPANGRPSTPQINLPDRTQLSDKGSIYSATTRSSFSDLDYDEDRAVDEGLKEIDEEVARNSTLKPQRPPFVSRFSSDTTMPASATTTTFPSNVNSQNHLQRPSFISQSSSDTNITSIAPTRNTGGRAAKPSPLTLKSTPPAPSTMSMAANPFSDPERSPVSPISLNSVDLQAHPDHNHTVSGISFGMSDFQLALWRNARKSHTDEVDSSTSDEQ